MPVERSLRNSCYGLLLLVPVARRLVFAGLLGAMFFASAGMVHADSFSDLLKDAIEGNDGIRAAEAAVAAADESVRVAAGGYYPTLNLSLEQGTERQNKVSGSANTSAAYSTAKLSGSQLLWDNLVVYDSIRLAELQADLARLNHQRATRDVLFEALQAFHELHRSQLSQKLSIDTVANLEEKLKLQEDLLAEESALERDVLQARVDLANGTASKISDDGALTVARNRFANVFRQESSDSSVYALPRLPIELMPTSLEEALRLALENNLDVLVAQKELEVARLTAKVAKRTLWGGTVSLKTESAFARDQGGTLGDKISHLLGVSAEIPLYSGGRDQAGYTAALESANQSQSTLQEMRIDLEETVRNAWDSVLTLTASAEAMELQEELSDELLVIAREELEVDGTPGGVLAAEAALLGASRGAENAETAKKLGYYQLLFDIGALHVDAFLSS